MSLFHKKKLLNFLSSKFKQAIHKILFLTFSTLYMTFNPNFILKLTNFDVELLQILNILSLLKNLNK